MVVWFTIYKIDVSGRKCGENVFWKIWHRQDLNLALMVQQVIMVSFNHGINIQICNSKDAAYIRVSQFL